VDAAAALSSDLRQRLRLPVEIVVLNDASPLLRFEAVVRGELILGPSVDRVLSFEKGVRVKFEDFRHIQEIFAMEHRRKLGIV
jgi:hypothetical protein